MMFENRVLRKDFEPKGKEVTAGLTELHDGQFQDLDSLPNIMGRMKQGG
jgi:hypothetical protein